MALEIERLNESKPLLGLDPQLNAYMEVFATKDESPEDAESGGGGE